MDSLPRPVPRTVTAYDYTGCRDYLQAKYGYDERDYAGRYAAGRDEAYRPYLDFWHWVLANYDVHNGGCVTFSRERLAEMGHEPDWVRLIYTRYLDEFADAAAGTLTMWTWW